MISVKEICGEILRSGNHILQIHNHVGRRLEEDTLVQASDNNVRACFVDTSLGTIFLRQVRFSVPSPCTTSRRVELLAGHDLSGRVLW